MTKKIFQICARGKCLMDQIPEEEFDVTWKTMNRMVGLIKTDYKISDLTYNQINLD